MPFLGAHAPLEMAPVSLSVSQSQKSLKQHKLEITRYGPEWSCMVPYGTAWSLMVTYGPLLTCMVLFGPLWSSKVPYGPIWYRMVLKVH